MQNGSRRMAWIGAALIALSGLIHLIQAAEEFGDSQLLGILFVADFTASALAVAGILGSDRGRGWGWGLGALLAAVTLAGYVLSRTSGLPGMAPEEWLNPAGLVSLAAEAGFLVVALIAWWGSRPAAVVVERREQG